MSKKTYVPTIRIISVEHDKTITATQNLRHALQEIKLDIPILDVFCHLEASRCGLQSGVVGIEVDGSVVAITKDFTPGAAKTFCKQLPTYIARKKEEFGITD